MNLTASGLTASSECSKKAAQFSGLAKRQSAEHTADIDRTLVVRARHGEEEAFADLFKKYQKHIARTLSLMIRNPAEVEELTQEVFIKAYLGLPAFRGDSAFYSWLYRIGINAAKNHLAASKRRVPTLTGVDIDEAENFAGAVQLQDLGTPLNTLRVGEMAHSVECAAAKLSPELRTALDLYEIRSMSYEDIARCEDCPIGTVRSRIFRAREAIADQLRPLLDAESDRVW